MQQEQRYTVGTAALPKHPLSTMQLCMLPTQFMTVHVQDGIKHTTGPTCTTLSVFLCVYRQWLPAVSLSQLKTLTLCQVANDHTISLLSSHFSSVTQLALQSCYYVSDWGLKRLCKMPNLAVLDLTHCQHISDYGLQGVLGSSSVTKVSVNQCDLLNERWVLWPHHSILINVDQLFSPSISLHLLNQHL